MLSRLYYFCTWIEVKRDIARGILWYIPRSVKNIYAGALALWYGINGFRYVHIVAEPLFGDYIVVVAEMLLQGRHSLYKCVGKKRCHLMCTIDVVVGVVLSALGD